MARSKHAEGNAVISLIQTLIPWEAVIASLALIGGLIYRSITRRNAVKEARREDYIETTEKLSDAARNRPRGDDARDEFLRRKGLK